MWLWLLIILHQITRGQFTFGKIRQYDTDVKIVNPITVGIGFYNQMVFNEVKFFTLIGLIINGSCK